MVKPQSRTITISNITPLVFNQLHQRYAETLKCPCLNTTVPYKDFVSSTTIFHPVCSSIFINQQWIKALYHPDASTFGPMDFRTTAKSQFELLASFCSLSQDEVFQNKIQFNNNELTTIYLLPEEHVRSEVNATFEFSKSSASNRIISFLKYNRLTTQANYLISALNTNIVIVIVMKIIQKYTGSGQWTAYSYWSDDHSSQLSVTSCFDENIIKPAVFLSFSNQGPRIAQDTWNPVDASVAANVSGFFGGCIPLEALLSSTLDCLYDIKCIKLLFDYFPGLNQTHFDWATFVLHSKQQNVSVNDHLLDLFIEEWSIKMNYSMYFDKCAPSFCMYTTTDQTNFFYAVTFLIGLEGGLIIILRLIVPFLVNVSSIFKRRSRNINVNFVYIKTSVRKFIQSVQRLNLFKEADNQTENSIKQQKISTRVYLILLAGMAIFSAYVSVFVEDGNKYTDF